MNLLFPLLSTASGGQLDALVSADVLAATSTHAGPGAGQPENMSAVELGYRARLDLRELDDRLRVNVDFRGRSPLAGAFPNRSLNLLYRAEARYALVKDRLWLGGGRFLAPTPVFLPMDGANLSFATGAFRGGLFGGRRGISTSRKNIGGFLPVAGGFFGIGGSRGSLDVTVAYAQDRVQFAAASEALEEDVGGVSAVVVGSVQPTDTVIVGGRVGMHPSASYFLGPTWSEATVEVQALDLFQAHGYGSFRPVDGFRLDVDVAHQDVQVWAAGTLEGGNRTADLTEPRFTDARLRMRVGPPKIGWVRPMVRYRVRPDRQELRTGLRVDANELGVPGLYATAQGLLDNITGENQRQDVGSRDRAYGSGALGFRRDGLDLQVGASYVERGAKPVSGRASTPANPGAPTASEDLQPFTLEADPIVSFRGFYSGAQYFVGADLEKHLTENEFRAFVQVGLVGGLGW